MKSKFPVQLKLIIRIHQTGGSKITCCAANVVLTFYAKHYQNIVFRRKPGIKPYIISWQKVKNNGSKISHKFMKT